MSGLFDQITNYSPPLLTAGQVNYKGTWDASANSPALTSPPAATTKGDYYVVSVAGTQFSITFAVGDWIISNGTAWEKVDLTDSVSSVFGRTGAVVGASTDYSAVGLTNTAIGAANPSTGAFTTVTASSTIAATGAVTGSNLSGTNTGDQTISITGDATASGSTGVLTATVSKINGTALSGLATGILKNTTTTGVPSIAVAADFPTLNQNTTGSAATLTTARGIYGNNFDGSAALTQVIASTYGGTGNGFAKFSGPASSEKTFTLPNASSTLLYDGGALGTPASGTVTNLTGTASININGTVGATTPAAGNFTSIGLTTQGSGAFTGLTASSDITIGTGGTANVSNGLVINSTSASSYGSYISMRAASVEKGVVSLKKVALGGSSNDLLLYSNSDNVVVYGGGALSGTFSSTGLAVTGALSSTTGANFATSSGNVGIGTASPVVKLSVVDSTNFFAATFQGTSSTNFVAIGTTGLGASINAYTAGFAATAPLVLQPNGGNVGIGVTPSVPLDILTSNSDVDVTALKLTHRSATLKVGTVIELGGASGSSDFVTRLIGYSQPNATYNTQFAIQTMNGAGSYVTGFTQDQNGNVGIGTTSPLVKFSVVGINGAESGTATPNGSISIGETGGNNQLLTLGVLNGSGNHSWIQSRNSSTTSTYALALNPSGGNVGIGTTSPNAKLTVSSAGGGNTNGLALTNSASGGGSYGLWVTATVNGEGANKLIFADYTAGVNRMTLDGSGNLLVGTTTTSGNAGFQFLPNAGGFVASIDHIAGVASGAFYYSYNYNGSSIGSVSQVGTTAVLYNTSSDYRLKDITGPLADSGTFIDSLKPKVGTWKADGSKFVGFLAHEFAEVCPSAVTGEKDAVDNDGKPVYQAMQASSAEVIANLVAELKSLRQRVAALENS